MYINAYFTTISNLPLLLSSLPSLFVVTWNTCFKCSLHIWSLMSFINISLRYFFDFCRKRLLSTKETFPSFASFLVSNQDLWRWMGIFSLFHTIQSHCNIFQRLIIYFNVVNRPTKGAFWNLYWGHFVLYYFFNWHLNFPAVSAHQACTASTARMTKSQL